MLTKWLSCHLSVSKSSSNNLVPQKLLNSKWVKAISAAELWALQLSTYIRILRFCEAIFLFTSLSQSSKSGPIIHAAFCAAYLTRFSTLIPLKQRGFALLPIIKGLSLSLPDMLQHNRIETRSLFFFPPPPLSSLTPPLLSLTSPYHCLIIILPVVNCTQWSQTPQGVGKTLQNLGDNFKM